MRFGSGKFSLAATLTWLLIGACIVCNGKGQIILSLVGTKQCTCNVIPYLTPHFQRRGWSGLRFFAISESLFSRNAGHTKVLKLARYGLQIGEYLYKKFGSRWEAIHSVSHRRLKLCVVHCTCEYIWTQRSVDPDQPPVLRHGFCKDLYYL